MTELKREFAFIVVAGGRGKRMALEAPKQFLNLGGRPMWLWSVLTAARILREIVIVAPAEFIQEMKSVCEAEKALSRLGVKVVPGGKERPDSVRNGLFSCSSDFVMIHDAARPFLSEALCLRLMAAVDERTGAIPLIPVADALKRVQGDSVEPVDRDGIFGAQTPQCFPRLALINALDASARAGIIPKDEAESWGASPLFTKEQGASPLFIKEQGASPLFIKEQGASPLFTKEQGASPLFTKEQGASPLFTKEQGASPLFIKKQGENPLFLKEGVSATKKADCRLKYVEGERLNFKITFPEDFIIAEALVKCREAE